MNIRSTYLKNIEILKPIFENEKIDNKKILQCIQISWVEINKFSKQIDKKQTDNFEVLLESIDYLDMTLTNEMFEEARDIFNSLKEEKDVKIYLGNYFRLIQTLLVFNKPLEESCDICQDVLFYFIDEETNDLYKECVYCGKVFAADSNIDESPKSKRRLRPAKMSELQSFFN